VHHDGVHGSIGAESQGVELHHVAIMIVGYLLGTFPSADIASRLAGGPDLRIAGSGNPGATNAKDVLGRRWGAAVLVADVAKTAVAALLGGDVAATASVVGHCFPVWSGFRGGKGVACAGGQLLVTFPAWLAPSVAIAFATRRLGAARVAYVLMVAWVLAAWVWRDVATAIATAVSASVVVYRFASSRE
jgi:glycerol-3-phosphate acyltransferase PlsY